MGFRIACAAIPMASADDVLKKLGLEKTSFDDEYNEEPYSGADVENGYFLIWKNTSDIDFSKKERTVLDRLEDCIILALSETVMSGFVCKVSKGNLDWQITYIGSEDEPQFFAEGQVPDHVTDLYKSLENNQLDDDVDETYEILSQTFKHYTGHKYDASNDFEFHALHAMKPTKSFWQFWK